MVLLKEISEGIWGLAVGPNKTSEVVAEHPIRLTMAALEIEDSETTENAITRVTIRSTTADKGPETDLILCNLIYPSCLQQPLDIEFHEGQTLSFGAKGPHKVHLTGYVLYPEPQEMYEEGQSPVKKGEIFQAADDSSSDDDDDDDDDDEDDSDDDDDDESEEVEDFHLAHRHRLRDDEDQDLEGDYEDGYLEGEDDLSSETSSSDSDEDEKQKVVEASAKGKKRLRAEANGHTNKQEPERKKLKKKQTQEQELTETVQESKKSKKAEKKTVSETEPTATNVDEKKKTNSLEITDTRVGKGPEAKLGKTVAVYYTGRLKSNNAIFDSCVKGKPFRFRLGSGEVIRGWDQGVKGMHVGGKRRLVIPPSLAYGSQKLPDIPPNSTLIFDIELKNVF